MRRLFLLFFLLTLSCSKDESEDKVDIVKPSYQVSVESTEGGTVSVSGGGSVSTTGGTYQSGESVTLTATPNDGYKFIGWSGTRGGNPAFGGSTANLNNVNPYTFTVWLNANLTANFESTKFELNVQ